MRLLALSALALATAAHAQCTADFAFSDFSDPASLTFVGDAFLTSDLIRLTPNTSGQAGAVWFASKATIAPGFSTQFTFVLNGAADGIAFVIQNQGPAALGGTGSGIGFGDDSDPGITSSIAIEIDTFNFPDEFPSDHISVQTRGLSENSSWDADSLAHAILAYDVNDGEAHTMKIAYDGVTLSVWLDDLDNPIIELAINLEDIDGDSILDDNGCAYIGFTASTGAATADQDILSWTFNDAGECQGVDINWNRTSIQFTGTLGSRMEQSFTTTGTRPQTYQWQINDVDLVDDDRIQGAQTPHLVIDPITPAEAGEIRMIAQNSCSGLGVSWNFSVCGSSDYNSDGDFGTDADIESFFACLAGNCCPDCAGSDFNFDGDFGTDADIEAFFRVLAGGNC